MQILSRIELKPSQYNQPQLNLLIITKTTKSSIDRKYTSTPSSFKNI